MARISGKYGPIAAAPIVGANAGSAGAITDPFSPQSIATAALSQQVQAAADTRYDPIVPPPTIHESFKNPYKNVTIGTTLLLIAIVLIHKSLTS